MNSSQIKTPFWAHDSKWSWLLNDVSELKEPEESYLDSGEVSRIKIIDSNLNQYEVSEVSIKGKSGIFGWKPGYKGRYLKVELNLSLCKRLQLDEAKDYMMKFASQHPEVYSSGIGIDELAKRIRESKDPKSLLSSFI
ncbi:hypothetical protein [Pleionea sp. CnH1-48]|uniref:hypothetical protein n=1 Tax=Pleionea sp. CnH1-48 TaxID=2954494 RepID=UPI0020971993|nr:hypothetical protein [Pleionea sp. CnH1-48]MCO7225903.1 hypothetical protein [Pleionea sp. CnH1-48]